MSRACCVALTHDARVCLQFVNVVFPDHTHLLFFMTEEGVIFKVKKMNILDDFPAQLNTFQQRFCLDKIKHTSARDQVTLRFSVLRSKYTRRFYSWQTLTNAIFQDFRHMHGFEKSQAQARGAWNMYFCIPMICTKNLDLIMQ